MFVEKSDRWVVGKLADGGTRRVMQADNSAGREFSEHDAPVSFNAFVCVVAVNEHEINTGWETVFHILTEAL